MCYKRVYITFSLLRRSAPWHWPFLAWPTRSGTFLPSVIVIAIRMTVKLNSIQDEMVYLTMLWFGHSFVSEYLIHWTRVFTFYGIVTSEYQNTFCKYTPSFWKLSLVNIYFRKVSAEAEEKKGYVKPVMMFNLCYEINMWFRMWVPVQYLLNVSENYAYGMLAVCMWHSLV